MKTLDELSEPHPDGEIAGAGTTAESPASQDSAEAATAPAASVPSPASRDEGDGSDGGGKCTPSPTSLPSREPMPRAEQLQEIGRMRECVKLLAEEIEAGWQRIIQEQQALGWPDFDHIQDATHALHRATMELDNLTHEMVMKMGWGPKR